MQAQPSVSPVQKESTVPVQEAPNAWHARLANTRMTLGLLVIPVRLARPILYQVQALQVNRIVLTAPTDIILPRLIQTVFPAFLVSI